MHSDTSAHASVDGVPKKCANNSCGASPSERLPPHIRAKVRKHPCYSEEAHHHYARMHLAVAPACNIQCHYCNRKYNCANESRPGVVSQLLTPEQAIGKALAVVGIAGPGDPLANPARTFATLRGLAERAPGLHLCLSTNGLMLPKFADELARLGVEHVTITINTLDPDMGARIYPGVFWDRRRLRGAEGARVLIEQQQRGLRMLVRRGILVKVNSVMIPGINDQHLPEVSRVVKAKGAFLHNIVPLISAPEHGTFYGLTGQRGPTAEELAALQAACGGDMRIMRHCRQCRADAVGLLGADRGAEFTLEALQKRQLDESAARHPRTEGHAAIKSYRPPASVQLGREWPWRVLE
jgi:nitrogen fixation protein NifB